MVAGLLDRFPGGFIAASPIEACYNGKMLPEILVDLTRDPEHRWVLTPTQIVQARQLVTFYKHDLGVPIPAPLIRPLVEPAHWAELTSIASQLDVPLDDVVLGNFYYDALKTAIGCTAFAIATPSGVLHARNLDWWSEQSALSRYSTVCRFHGAPAGDFITIGWPGFTGCFSGLAPGRFAVSLNAVLSFDPVRMAGPVILLLRTVLETCRSFADALAVLRDTPIPCDCLLLLTGTLPDEMVVIERTPSRSATRLAVDGFVAVTNDYRALDIATDGSRSVLQTTSCGRFERIEQLLRKTPVDSLDACIRHLSDPGVKMGITVQQMVFNASTGRFVVQA